VSVWGLGAGRCHDLLASAGTGSRLCLTSGGSVPNKNGMSENSQGSQADLVCEMDPQETLEKESADYFASFVQLLGFPRSIGQIYGLLYMSSEPITMEEVVTKLGISKGSASQGLNWLRNLGAISVTRIDGERRDHFVADFDVTRIVKGFLDERLQPRFAFGEERLKRMRSILDREDYSAGENDSSSARVKALEKWHRRGVLLVPAVRRFFRK